MVAIRLLGGSKGAMRLLGGGLSFSTLNQTVLSLRGSAA